MDHGLTLHECVSRELADFLDVEHVKKAGFTPERFGRLLKETKNVQVSYREGYRKGAPPWFDYYSHQVRRLMGLVDATARWLHGGEMADEKEIDSNLIKLYGASSSLAMTTAPLIFNRVVQEGFNPFDFFRKPPFKLPDTFDAFKPQFDQYLEQTDPSKFDKFANPFKVPASKVRSLYYEFDEGMAPLNWALEQRHDGNFDVFVGLARAFHQHGLQSAKKAFEFGLRTCDLLAAGARLHSLNRMFFHNLSKQLELVEKKHGKLSPQETHSLILFASHRSSDAAIEFLKFFAGISKESSFMDVLRFVESSYAVREGAAQFKAEQLRYIFQRKKPY